MLMTLARQGKNWLLPSGPSYRRIPIGPLAGCTLSIEFRHQTLQYIGLYEYELRGAFERLVRPDYDCFDVGGASGYHAMLLAKRTGGRVVCIDCDPGSVAAIRETVRRNPYPVEVVSAMIGAGGGDGTLALDTLAAQTFMPDFIKMDIEGAEANALCGAAGILAARHPSLIVEVHGAPVEEECLSILSRHGYGPEIVNPRQWLRDYRPLDHNRWLVCEGRA